MSKEEDVVHDAIERLEWDERKEEDTPFKRMRQVTRRTALTGGAAGIGALILQACGRLELQQQLQLVSSATVTGTASAATGGSAAAGIFGVSKTYKFTLRQPRHHQPVLHADAERRRGRLQAAGVLLPVDRIGRTATSARWSTRSTAPSAPASTASAVALISLTAFNSPTNKALAAKIPVVAYNADAAGNPRLAYIGQDLFVSGQEMGKHIAAAGSLRRRRAVHRDTRIAEHPAADRRRPAGAQVALEHQDARGRDRSGAHRRSCRRSTPT